jgi:hypothetical protein
MLHEGCHFDIALESEVIIRSVSCDLLQIWECTTKLLKEQSLYITHLRQHGTLRVQARYHDT